VSSAAAALTEEIEERIPRNCSLGTKRFCIGYRHESNCTDLPFNISSLLPGIVEDLPGPVEDAIRERIGALAPLAESLTTVPALYVPQSLISGLVLMVAVTVLSVCVAFGWPLCVAAMLQGLSVGLRTLALLALAVVCCSPFIVLASVLHTVLRAADGLPSWVGVDRGGACGFCFGALACALFLTLFAAGAPVVGARLPRARRERRG
jgi:hypothetical protein